MQFTTPVSIDPTSNPISYGDGIFLIGSCFSEHIGQKLSDHGYHTCLNPSGILFNPKSILNTLVEIASQKIYTEQDLVEHDSIFHSLHHHGRYSNADAQTVLTRINNDLSNAHTFLSKAKFVFISLGSAGCFRYKSTNQIVANCHKISANAFERIRLSWHECVEIINAISHTLRTINPDIILHWTISPVKYLREGIIENQRSKSTLILALEQHLKEHPAETYFPAYEIVQDELRDYRYYAQDMAHPSSQTIEYIWERFSETHFPVSERKIHTQVQKVVQAKNHNIVTNDKASVRKFAEGQLRQLDEISTEIPLGNWQPLRQYFFHLTEPD